MDITPEVYAQVVAALKSAQFEAITMQSRLPPPYRQNQADIAKACKEALAALGAK
jgi:hypothetical protein